MPRLYAGLFLLSGLVLVLMLACAQAESPQTTVPASVAESTPASETAGPTENQLAPTRVQSSTESLDCIGPDGIREIRAAYAANHLRAEDTYIGERMCLRGAIGGFAEEELGAKVFVRVGEEVRFYLWHRSKSARGSEATDEEKANWPGWRDWMMSSNVGDRVEAECRLKEFTPTKLDPKRERGIPLFTDCHRVVDGVRWTPPTPTPSPPPPTPTLAPCVAEDVGDPYYRWLRIDCPGGRVILGQGNYRDYLEDFQFISEGDSSVISFYFRTPSGDHGDDRYDYHSSWKRWVEPPEGGKSAKELWEAPPEVAEIIISEWRRGRAAELNLVVGECCEFDPYFQLDEP